MKKYLTVLIPLFFLMACNSEKVAVKENTEKKEQVKIQEPVYPVVDVRFEKLRKVAIDSLVKRRAVLEKEEKCINASTNRETLKKCFNDANEQRKVVAEEIGKKKEVKVEKKIEPKPVEVNPEPTPAMVVEQEKK